jgi:S-adenosylmethionine hydrolase
MSTPFVSFLTDFGGAASAPAVCRGVIWGIAPEARICDISHSVARFAVRDGAFLLFCTLPYLPIGVHLAVVDPGVGTARRPIAIRAGRGDLLVGPDNGLLVPAARALGGITEVRTLENASLWLPRVSSTFHGRDLFAPVAAHLARGVAYESVGPQLPSAEIVDLSLPDATARDGGLDSTVLFVDTFGNCRLAGEADDLAAVAGGLRAGRPIAVFVDGHRTVVPWAATFGAVPVGTALLYEDADYAGLAIGVNQGSAAERFGLELDKPIRLEPI